MHLVFLPGMDGGSHLLERFCGALPVSLSYGIITYPSGQCLGYDDLERRVRTRVESLNEPFAIVAESFSGPIAIRIAAAPLTNLRAVILVSTFHSSPLPKWLRFMVHPVLFRAPMPSWVVRRYLLGTEVDADLLLEVKNASDAVRPEVMAARAQAIFAEDVRPLLSHITVPVLCISGKNDNLVAPFFSEAIPRVYYAVIDGPHLTLQTNPDDAVRAIVTFLELVTSPLVSKPDLETS